MTKVKKLPSTYNVGSYRCRLIKRNTKVALYAISAKNHSQMTYEVFKVRIVPPSPYVPYPREKKPSNEEFGVTAWNPLSLERAEKIYQEIVEGQR